MIYIPDFPLRMGIFKGKKAKFGFLGQWQLGEAEREGSREKFQSQLLNPNPLHHMSKTPFP